MQNTTIEGYRNTTLAARDQRILEGLPLVKQIAGVFSAKVPRTVDPEDLISAGTLGLIRAVDAFDPARGVEFSAFARYRIRGSILDHLRALDPLPYSTRVRLRRIESCMLALQASLGRTPTENEVAKAVGFTPEQVSDLMARASSLTLLSLDEGQDSDNVQDHLADENGPDVLTAIERREMKEILADLIRELPRSERLILSLYYYEGLKMSEIGNLLGITESRVSQIHARAVTLLRAHVRGMQEKRE